MLHLKEHGWAIVEGVNGSSEMMHVARQLGRPLRAPTGELVKAIVPVERQLARPGTLSARWGRDAFPLHTDTAFWPVPSRYVVMRVRGDLNRTTEILPFEQLWSDLEPRARTDAERSVWRTPQAKGGIYCSMMFGAGGIHGWRYDAAVMMPVNAAAVRTNVALGDRVHDLTRRETVCWEPKRCLIVDNWRVLHARGPAPLHETMRVLFRIYVG